MTFSSADDVKSFISDYINRRNVDAEGKLDLFIQSAYRRLQEFDFSFFFTTKEVEIKKSVYDEYIKDGKIPFFLLEQALYSKTGISYEIKKIEEVWFKDEAVSSYILRELKGKNYVRMKIRNKTAKTGNALLGFWELKEIIKHTPFQEYYTAFSVYSPKEDYIYSVYNLAITPISLKTFEEKELWVFQETKSSGKAEVIEEEWITDGGEVYVHNRYEPPLDVSEFIRWWEINWGDRNRLGKIVWKLNLKNFPTTADENKYFVLVLNSKVVFPGSEVARDINYPRLKISFYDAGRETGGLVFSHMGKWYVPEEPADKWEDFLCTPETAKIYAFLLKINLYTGTRIVEGFERGERIVRKWMPYAGKTSKFDEVKIEIWRNTSWSTWNLDRILFFDIIDVSLGWEDMEVLWWDGSNWVENPSSLPQYTFQEDSIVLVKRDWRKLEMKVIEDEEKRKNMKEVWFWSVEDDDYDVSQLWGYSSRHYRTKVLKLSGIPSIEDGLKLKIKGKIVPKFWWDCDELWRNYYVLLAKFTYVEVLKYLNEVELARVYEADAMQDAIRATLDTQNVYYSGYQELRFKDYFTARETWDDV